MLNQRNTITVTTGAVAAAIVLFICVTISSANADQVRVERQQTLQAKIATCEPIKDTGLRITCVAAVGDE